MSIPVHRNHDKRRCGASTIVTGQINVFVNGLLASVQDDPNTHGNGELNASVNDGTIFVNNKKLVLLGSSAKNDRHVHFSHPTGHPNPFAASGSPNVFASGGPPFVEEYKSDTIRGTGARGRQDGSGAGRGTGSASTESAQSLPADTPTDITFNQEGFCKGVDVYNQLRAEGYSDASAAGMVGNILHESDQFQADIEYGSGIGRGWLQWSYGRRDNFETYAVANNLDPTTDTANYNFLQYELEGQTGNHWSRGYSLSEYKTITDPSAATEYFMRGYERPAEKTANLSARQEFARKLAEGDHDCDTVEV